MGQIVFRQRFIPVDIGGLNIGAPYFNARASIEAIISPPAL
jgi:hypothetical protein